LIAQLINDGSKYMGVRRSSGFMIMNAGKISIGFVLSIGLLLFGFFAIDQKEKETQRALKIETVTEVTKIKSVVAQPNAGKMERLPNAEAEASKWNNIVRGQFITKNRFLMKPEDIKKDESRSDQNESTFYHIIDQSFNISVIYVVDNQSGEITQMRLEGYEKDGVDKSAIFYAMSAFVSYVDSEIPLLQAGEYVVGIPFETDKEGIHVVNFKGKKFDFVLDLTSGLNMMVYEVT